MRQKICLQRLAADCSLSPLFTMQEPIEYCHPERSEGQGFNTGVSLVDTIKVREQDKYLHKDTHSAVATNCFGKQLLELQITNSREDFETLIQRVKKISSDQGLAPVFGLEDRWGFCLSRNTEH